MIALLILNDIYNIYIYQDQEYEPFPPWIVQPAFPKDMTAAQAGADGFPKRIWYCVGENQYWAKSLVNAWGVLPHHSV